MYTYIYTQIDIYGHIHIYIHTLIIINFILSYLFYILILFHYSSRSLSLITTATGFIPIYLFVFLFKDNVICAIYNILVCSSVY